MPRTLYAVHVNGALVTTDALRQHGHDFDVLFQSATGQEAIFDDVAEAGDLAVELRERFPEDVVAIVLWFEGSRDRRHMNRERFEAESDLRRRLAA